MRGKCVETSDVAYNMQIARFMSRIGFHLVALILASASAVALGAPPTSKPPATNTYHGTIVVDDYIWLENFDDPAVKAWNAEENKVTRAYLDKLPARQQVGERLRKLYYDTS